MSLDVTTCHSVVHHTTIDPTSSRIATFKYLRAMMALSKKGDCTITRRRCASGGRLHRRGRARRKAPFGRRQNAELEMSAVGRPGRGAWLATRLELVQLDPGDLRAGDVAEVSMVGQVDHLPL